ncbi:RICIN domain-containing protein [Paractinoplanes toevensis]|uniref:Ricin B lectin domain-containing protein n=1 Tax=Paractinoplanes toevensis TaxID=571911 RepID=A0A919T828_9ACTN|nr:RICIN domain-containing protein [Actinoplanes toevensis]GIM90412.1 hypothetical protein Ato02nite_022050 [Actinoplanes toevensis]
MKKVLTAMIATLGLLLVGAAPAHAAPVPPDPNLFYTYISVLAPNGVSKKVLDIKDRSPDERGIAQLWNLIPNDSSTNTNNPSTTNWNQRWTIKQTTQGSGIYYIINKYTSMCLDKSQDTPNANGNKVYQATCHWRANQQWKVEHVTATDDDPNWWWTKLVNQDGGRCLDVPGADFTAGKQLVVWDCNGNRNQRWNIF